MKLEKMLLNLRELVNDVYMNKRTYKEKESDKTHGKKKYRQRVQEQREADREIKTFEKVDFPNKDDDKEFNWK